MKGNILIIDDNQDVAHALRVLFTLNKLDCQYAATPEEGLEMLANQSFDLVIQDMNFSQDTTSGEEGVKLFADIRNLYPDLPIILMTAWTSLETAVELVRSGASDYIGKPWDDDKLIVTIRNLIELGELQKEQREVASGQQKQRSRLFAEHDLCGLKFQSDAMANLLQITTQVAASNVAVLITGPNGAGKEKIAEILQANSHCKNGPFVRVNMGALSPELMAAELFGAEAGSYTGSTKQRVGRFELADKGTLFLDEIANLSLDGQAKLLRVLESGEFERIGATETLKVDVRIISATNADLKAEIAKGKFREDLYYRLNVIELKLPALKDRKADVVPLAEYFLAEGKYLSEQAAKVLKLYDWPGNIRELKNTMQRASLLSLDNEVSAEVLGIEVEVPSGPEKTDELTAQDIKQAIANAGGVISDAAKSLGLSRSALYRRMKKFDIAG